MSLAEWENRLIQYDMKYQFFNTPIAPFTDLTYIFTDLTYIYIQGFIRWSPDMCREHLGILEYFKYFYLNLVFLWDFVLRQPEGLQKDICLQAKIELDIPG